MRIFLKNENVISLFTFSEMLRCKSPNVWTPHFLGLCTTSPRLVSFYLIFSPSLEIKEG